jgi:hypothetical protein
MLLGVTAMREQHGDECSKCNGIPGNPNHLSTSRLWRNVQCCLMAKWNDIAGAFIGRPISQNFSVNDDTIDRRHDRRVFRLRASKVTWHGLRNESWRYSDEGIDLRVSYYKNDILAVIAC